MIKSIYRRAETKQKLDRAVSIPHTTEAWIAVLNPGQNQAPEGGNAYGDSADAELGRVGIAVSADGIEVTVTMPAFDALARRQETLGFLYSDNDYKVTKVRPRIKPE